MVDIINLIVDTLEKNAALSGKISLEELPSDGGLYAELGPGYNESLYYDKSAIRLIPVVFLAKSIDQAWCVQQLTQIGVCLQDLRQYPKAEGCNWMDAVFSTGPSKVGRQEDGQFIYTCTVNTKFYLERKE